jgi:Do/DeqQ family serine protease
MLRIMMSLMLVVLVTAGAHAETAVPQSREQVLLSFAPIVKRSSPAVVNVYAQRIEKQRDSGLMADPFFRRFFGEDGNFGRPRERVANSLGSGVIVGKEGYIVTNNHVIANGTDIRVVLADRREFEAKLLLADERTDLAVLKINAADEDLPALAFADSDELEVGDLVLAIGNPFGVGQTVTSGIVSALARTQVGITDYQFFIQTDAAINPGNSGGALVNMQGELVGINTAIFSRSGGSIGIGFSIPSNMVETVVASAESGSSKIKRPWLGVELQDVTQDLADSMGFARPEGTLITSMHPKSPLVSAGLKRGDVIIGFDGKVVEGAREFGFRVGTTKIGETRIVEYRRGDETFEARMRLMAAPETVPRDETLIDNKSPLAGLVVANLSPAVAEEIGFAAEATGVVTLEVKDELAARLFKRGDVVYAVNGTEVSNVSELMAAIDTPQQRWEIGVQRDKRRLRLKFRQ